ncbi:MAG: hypothetical protein R3Y32_02145 [Bacillota bacterium]
MRSKSKIKLGILLENMYNEGGRPLSEEYIKKLDVFNEIITKLHAEKIITWEELNVLDNGLSLLFFDFIEYLNTLEVDICVKI